MENYYSNKPDLYFENSRKEMIQFIPQNISTVLDIGCGVGAFSKNLKEIRTIHATGVEFDLRSADVARQHLDRVIAKDIESALKDLAGEQFDCIVCNDVLEHLIDPWSTLEGLRPLLSDSGVLVVSLPNIRYFPVFKPFVMQGEWEYAEMGVMDQTHLRFFTKNSMQAMMEKCGFVVQSVQGINATPLPWKANMLVKLFAHRLDDVRYQQFALVASRAN